MHGYDFYKATLNVVSTDKPTYSVEGEVYILGYVVQEEYHHILCCSNSDILQDNKQ